MALRLQLEDGTIKEYSTWYPIYYGQGEGKPHAYGTKCGIRWNQEPDRSDGCGHVDCALRACGGGIFSGIIIALFFTGFAAFGLYIMIQEGGYAWIILLIPAIASIAFSYSMIKHSWKNQKILNQKILDEIWEFRDYGTINGLKAQMIESYSTINEMDNIKTSDKRSSKLTLRYALFPIVFLTLGAVWFFSVMLVMIDIGRLTDHKFESPIPFYLHPLAWAFAIIGGLYMEAHKR